MSTAETEEAVSLVVSLASHRECDQLQEQDRYAMQRIRIEFLKNARAQHSQIECH